MSIWILSWTTESSDSGINGYWTHEPTDAELEAFCEENFPDDHERGTLYTELIKLEEIDASIT